MNQKPSDEQNKPLDENLLDHNYDGIQELDNPLPRWWVHLFNGTIVFSALYMIVITFFVPSAGALADKKVEAITARMAVKPALVADAGASADAQIVFPAGPETLEVGAKNYAGKCAACHGAKGEGLVGPNLTDAYWIHGKGTEADIYKVVVEGVPEKGMISWKTLMNDEEIKATVVYIKSLQGTSPSNPKAPQGELVG